MHLAADPDIQALRKQAARLLEDVLDERISAQFAINRWPETGELSDPSLDSAFQALWHFEADEDQQHTELYYLDAQLELLKQIAGFLKEGKDLPAYFLRAYPRDHTVRFFYNRSLAEDSRHLLQTAWLHFKRLWQLTCQAAGLERADGLAKLPVLRNAKKLPRP